MKAGWIALSILLFYSRQIYAQSDSCQHLKEFQYLKPQTESDAKNIYDTLRLYIERCAAIDNDSYMAFHSLTTAVTNYAPTDTTRFDLYRNWLISVLYLNKTNPAYFCNCLGAIAMTYQYGKYNSTIAGLAVLDYIRNNHSECWGAGLDKLYHDDSIYAIQKGFDPTKLPPLDSLGLGFLLHQDVNNTGILLSQNYIRFFSAFPNPFKDETNIRFHLNRMAYTTIGIYDVLGHQVWGDGKGRSLEAGDHEVVVDGSLLPEGSLYARIETGFGEVRTVKLDHD